MLMADLSYEIFLNHLDSPEYQSGEIEGRWGILDQENRPTWPILFFWISARNSKVYNFKFDFTGYPENAPTAVLWDLEKKSVLAAVERPNFSKRAIQVFKIWGHECNYLPCDRLAFQGHSSWLHEHAALIWNNQQDTFIKYLNELFQILN
jgi:hypothetical protein